ncbi:MAG TPA: VOC family protein [Chloroflexota bacterium]
MSTDSPVAGLSFKVHHTMLPVADLSRSIDFYTRLLGMKQQSRHANPTRGVEVGLLGYGDEVSTPYLELTQDISAAAPAQVTPANIHIGIDVSDLRQLATILEQEDIRFTRPVRERSDGKGLTAWIEDPDGHPLELAERYA